MKVAGESARTSVGVVSASTKAAIGIKELAGVKVVLEFIFIGGIADVSLVFAPRNDYAQLSAVGVGGLTGCQKDAALSQGERLLY